MNSLQATHLLDELKLAYPGAVLDGARSALYVKQLRLVSFPVGQEAVEHAVALCKFFPSLAELAEQSHFAQERARRSREEAQTREQRDMEDNLPRPDLHSIPVVVDFMKRWDITPALVETESGVCDDCKRDGRRWDFDGKLALCASCSASRLAAVAKLKRIENVETLTGGSP